MSIMQCAAINCKSTETSNVAFFRFPEDEVTRKKWVNAIYRGDWVPTKRDLLCSLHFPTEAFVIASNKKYLKSEAIPSITDIDETIKVNTKSVEYVKETVQTNPPPMEPSLTDYKVGSSNTSIPIVVHLPHTNKSQFADAPKAPITKPVGALRKLTKKRRFIKQWPIQNIVLSNGQNARIVLRPKAYIIKPDGTFVKTKVIPELLLGENEVPSLLDENDAPIDIDDVDSPQILQINTTRKDFDVQTQKISNASTIPNDDSDMVDVEEIISPKIIKTNTLKIEPNLQLQGVKVAPTTKNYDVFQNNIAASNGINASKIINIDLTNENLDEQQSTTETKMSQIQPIKNAANGNLQIQMERRYYLEKVDHPKQKYVIKKIDVPQIKVDKKPPVPIIASSTLETTNLGETIKKVNIGQKKSEKTVSNVPASGLTTPSVSASEDHDKNMDVNVLRRKLEDQRTKIKVLQQVIRRRNQKLEAILGPSIYGKKKLNES